ncbi:MAG TPA: 16S rRNA (guanine(527)-N(7))-methyltransferase RsmG [Acidobacteriaceae bacterium]|jgi:16S rRNA (guanine527-N7)-methyltransferase
MPTLSNDTIRNLLAPFRAPHNTDLPDSLIDGVSTYLDLLIRWNARVSLTAIRHPEEIIQRHFGESLFTGAHLAQRLPGNAELLDYGSGPGFPGLPIQMLLPNLRVTVAESQTRKVAFLREVIRTLNLPAQAWQKRVEEMPPDRQFDAVTLRAVEKMQFTLENAKTRVRDGGWLAALVGQQADKTDAQEYRIPGSEHRRLLLWQIVPRGTIQS